MSGVVAKLIDQLTDPNRHEPDKILRNIERAEDLTHRIATWLRTIADLTVKLDREKKWSTERLTALRKIDKAIGDAEAGGTDATLLVREIQRITSDVLNEEIPF